MTETFQVKFSIYKTDFYLILKYWNLKLLKARITQFTEK